MKLPKSYYNLIRTTNHMPLNKYDFCCISAIGVFFGFRYTVTFAAIVLQSCIYVSSSLNAVNNLYIYVLTTNENRI